MWILGALHELRRLRQINTFNWQTSLSTSAIQYSSSFLHIDVNIFSQSSPMRGSKQTTHKLSPRDPFARCFTTAFKSKPSAMILWQYSKDFCWKKSNINPFYNKIIWKYTQFFIYHWTKWIVKSCVQFFNIKYWTGK